MSSGKKLSIGKPFSSTFANFRNSLCYRKLQIIPHLFMHFPTSKIHKELGHCPDAGYPKMAKVEFRGCPENPFYPIRAVPSWHRGYRNRLFL